MKEKKELNCTVLKDIFKKTRYIRYRNQNKAV